MGSAQRPAMGRTPTPILPRFAGEGAEHYPLSRKAGEGWGGGAAIGSLPP